MPVYVAGQNTPFEATITAEPSTSGHWSGSVKFTVEALNAVVNTVPTPWFTPDRHTEEEALEEASQLWYSLLHFAEAVVTKFKLEKPGATTADPAPQAPAEDH